jgi:hypothetical protein
MQSPSNAHKTTETMRDMLNKILHGSDQIAISRFNLDLGASNKKERSKINCS